MIASTNMKLALTKIRRALSRQDIAPELTQYLVQGGTISAYDGRFVACCPVAYQGTFLVPGREFEAILDRLPDEFVIDLETEAVTLRAGRLRGTIRLLPPATATFPQPSSDWVTPPVNFLPALRLARPFISDNAIHSWALCVSLEFNLMRATTNVSLVEVDCFDLDASGQLLPSWSIDYILSRSERLTGVQVHPDYAAFAWDDGSWMRTQLIQGKFPEQGKSLFAEFESPRWAITPAWKAAYKTVSELAESEIAIYPDKLVGVRGVGTTECAVSTSVREEGAKFDPGFLSPVIESATHIDFGAYPNVVSFVAPGLRGIIAGRR